jgi:hypothetical protein
MTTVPRLIAAALALVGCCAQAQAVHGELRLQHTAQEAGGDGPLAVAHRMSPLVPDGAGSTTWAEAEVAGGWRALQANVLLRQDVGSGTTTWRINELYAAHEQGAWGLSAGKRILGWDVGQAFRPNDLVQQEVRRALFATTLEGRELLQVEHFGAASATSLVWVQPQHGNEPARPPVETTESAWAARQYLRLGSTDLYGYARLGRHSGPTLGASAAWVLGDAWGFTASVRWMEQHATAFQASAGAASQWMAGLSWTGESQQSLLVEAWHDGSAPRDADWRTWQQRNAVLNDPGLLAAQASVLQPSRLRQDNVFVRLGWQPGAWTWTADLLWMPADHGRVLTLAGQWQGDRFKVYAALRRNAGPATSLVAQLPQDTSGVLALTWPF